MVYSIVRRLLLLATTLCAVLSAAISLAQVGRLSPAPQTLAFNPPGCELPCVLNIVPGVTTKSQAEKILATYTSFQQAADPDFHHQLIGDAPDRPYIAPQYGSSGTAQNVNMVRIAIGQSTYRVTTLGQLLAAGHKVKRIFRSNYAMGTQDSGLFLITFDDNEQIIAVIYAFGAFVESSPIPDIYVIGGPDQYATLQMIRLQWHSPDEIRWAGFTSIQYYLNTPALP